MRPPVHTAGAIARQCGLTGARRDHATTEGVLPRPVPVHPLSPTVSSPQPSAAVAALRCGARTLSSPAHLRPLTTLPTPKKLERNA